MKHYPWVVTPATNGKWHVSADDKQYYMRPDIMTAVALFEREEDARLAVDLHNHTGPQLLQRCKRLDDALLKIRAIPFNHNSEPDDMAAGLVLAKDTAAAALETQEPPLKVLNEAELDRALEIVRAVLRESSLVATIADDLELSDSEAAKLHAKIEEVLE